MRMCFALAVVNVMLITGVIVAAVRARTSQTQKEPGTTPNPKSTSTVASSSLTTGKPSVYVTTESSHLSAVSLQAIMRDKNPLTSGKLL